MQLVATESMRNPERKVAVSIGTVGTRIAIITTARSIPSAARIVVTVNRIPTAVTAKIVQFR